MRTIASPPSLGLIAVALLSIVADAGAEVVLEPLRAVAKRGPNLVPNGGFEETEGGKPAGWLSKLTADFATDTQAFHTGKASLRFTKPNADTRFWVSRTVMLDQKKPTPLVVSGWSKAEGVSGTMGADYSVWVDLQYTDGTPLWGQRAPFEVGTHDWQYSEHPIVVGKPVKLATVNVLFRGSYTGTVWFDDVSLQELQVEGAGVFDGQNVARPALSAKETRHVARLSTKDGLTLGLSEEGGVSELDVNGTDLLGGAPGGFWLRDVAAAGPWVRPRCQVTREGETAKIEGTDEKLGLRLEARIEPSPTSLDFAATVIDTTDADRAVTAYFVLPLSALGWTWHDDIVRSLPTAAGGEYRNAQGWPAAGASSTYPLCSLTSPKAGLSLAAPMDCPRVSRFVYNSSVNALFIAVDLGLTRETLNFPSRADFRFSLFHHAPEWGFRAAAAKYYERFPQFFEQRLKRGGIWMAFADISKVAGYEDFGFAYDELGGNFTAFDDAHDIASFQYIEPMTYWLSMDKKYARTYDGAMQALADNEASGKPDPVKWAQTTRRCGVFAQDGRFDLSIENQSWCDGAVFTLNPDPDLPEDAACPVNKAHLGYTKQWADTHLLQPQGGRLDGIYLDSLPNWGERLNWRREHWRTAKTPLTFDPETKKPVLMQIFSTWDFSKWVADDVHARGGVMHGNGGALWPYFPALLDITGQETGSVLSDQTMALARTLLRNKPYSPLMNTRFDQMGPEVVADYFNQSLLYCIFPSFFNGTYMKDGKWVTVHYFTDPQFYERDRPLFRKYIPVLRRMFDAGWEPITYARAESPSMRVERYGDPARGELLFAVYNPTKAAVEAKLVVETATLKLPDDAQATALVSGATLTVQRDGPTATITVSLPAATCEVVRLGKP